MLIAHGPVYTEWHHLIQYAPLLVPAVAGIGWATLEMVKKWWHR